MIAVLRRTLVAVLLAPVHLWRATAVFRQPRCRYYPSCSTYAVGALREHGPLRGGSLAARRLLRCHPWSVGGLDPVPTSDATSRPPRPSAVRSSGARDA
jgi:putative membrane protein insertion efficiency factor